MSRSKALLALAGLALFAGTACEGKVGLSGADDIPGFQKPTPGEGPTTTTEPPPGTIMRPPDEVVDEVCQFIQPGTSPLRRLTRDEYHNSVRDLFPFAELAEQAFTQDERPFGFEANTVLPVGDLHIEEYQRAAESISERVVASLDAVLPDDSDAPTVRQFIEDYGRRAYRRPLETSETDALFAVYEAGAAAYDHATGAQMLVEALLQSPTFLYRVEGNTESADEVIPVEGYEMATRLSYFLWGSIPDDTLLDAAEAGELATVEQVEAQARRMLDSPRARVRVNEVFSQWLRVDEVDKVDSPDEAFTDEMRSSMVAETEAFIDHVLWESDGTVSELLSADYTFVDSNTAEIYGLQMRTADDGLQRVDLPANRKGILSHPSVLTAQGHGQTPVYRGKFIRDAFLCLSDSPPSPPDTIEPLESFEGESMRSKAEKRLNATTEGCAGCHAMMDGIGLAFDNYDGLGRFRTEDEFGNVLHGGGEIQFTASTDGPIDGVPDLAQKLADSKDVADCASKQFFQYAVAREALLSERDDSDACNFHIVSEALANSNNDVKEMFVALTTTDAFRYRMNTTGTE